MFGLLRIGAVFFRAGAIEADHGILHTKDGAVHRDRYRVGIVEGEFGIDIERLDNGMGGIFTPERFSFIGVIGHRPDWLAGRSEGVLDGIPDEFSGAGPGEVTDVFCFENPCFSFLGVGFLVLFGLFGSDDEERFLRRFGFLEPFHPIGF